MTDGHGDNGFHSGDSGISAEGKVKPGCGLRHSAATESQCFGKSVNTTRGYGNSRSPRRSDLNLREIQGAYESVFALPLFRRRLGAAADLNGLA